VIRFNFLLPTLAAALLAVTLLPVSLFATDASCQPVFDAASKVLRTPAHVYTTTTVPGGKPRIGELIYAEGAIYVKTDGKWSRSRMTTQQMLDQEKENRQNTKGTCRYLRDESVSGETAVVYEENSESDDAKTVAQAWISKSKGLPLRTEMDMETTHISVRYDYANVHAPAGVQ
jgi:hypothetical protein